MFDPVQYIFRIVYFYSRVLGVINFEIDMASGQARTTRRASIYAALANVLIFGALPFLTRSQLLQTLWTNAGLLHEYLFLFIHANRVSCVLITLLSRWWQRRRLIHLINAYCRLAFRKPEVTKIWRRRVIIKFMSVLFSELSQVLTSFSTLQTFLTVKQVLSVYLLYILTALVNVIVSHFFFITLNAYGHYILLNQELEAVLLEMRSLEDVYRRDSFIIKCSSLADRLENIAKTQSEVQILVERTSRIFDIQGICITCIMYLSAIATIYFTFASFYQNSIAQYSPIVIAIFVIEIICYFTDLFITMDNLYIVKAVHNEMVKILEEFTTIAPGLDQRLEKAIEMFQLQLRQNPLKMRLLQLYSVERTKVIAMVSSVVTNSLVLVQYELQNT